MKSLLLIFLLSSSLLVSAQPTVYYTYDDAGNRIHRDIIELSGKQDETGDSTATETPEVPIVDEQQLQEEDGIILAYPNPTDGNLTVAISANLLEETGANYIIVDLAGKVIEQGQLVQSQTILDLTNEANGNYILTVFVGERREEWQIVKN